MPGARGCTAQTCAFRDRHAEIEALGARLAGLSAQPAPEQDELARREGISYPLLSDPGFRLAEALRLPTFEAAGKRLYRRLTLIARAGRIEYVIYPVFPPGSDAEEVATWLREHSADTPEPT
ncbi:MAG: peroxiredoxin [Thermoleophilaceae bacterium]